MKNELEEFGMTGNEAEIYLLLLQRGTMTASGVSQSLSFHRGYTL